MLEAILYLILYKVRFDNFPIELELKEKQFTKEVERYMLNEAITSLKVVENHLNGYLQVDKHNGN